MQAFVLRLCSLCSAVFMAYDLAKYGDRRLVYYSVVLVCGTETWALYVCLCVCVCMYVCLCVCVCMYVCVLCKYSEG